MNNIIMYISIDFGTCNSVISIIDDNKYIYKADPYYKTTEFHEKYRFALFKIITNKSKVPLINLPLSFSCNI